MGLLPTHPPIPDGGPRQPQGGGYPERHRPPPSELGVGVQGVGRGGGTTARFVSAPPVYFYCEFASLPTPGARRRPTAPPLTPRRRATRVAQPGSAHRRRASSTVVSGASHVAAPHPHPPILTPPRRTSLNLNPPPPRPAPAPDRRHCPSRGRVREYPYRFGPAPNVKPRPATLRPATPRHALHPHHTQSQRPPHFTRSEHSPSLPGCQTARLPRTADNGG